MKNNLSLHQQNHHRIRTSSQLVFLSLFPFSVLFSFFLFISFLSLSITITHSTSLQAAPLPFFDSAMGHNYPRNPGPISRTAFGAPGITPTWASAKKTQVGTSFFQGFRSDGEKPASLVWFTASKGILSEVYYPTIDKAQIKDSQFLVTDHRTFFAEEKVDTEQKIKVLTPALVEYTNRHKAASSKFSIKHLYFTLNNAHTLVDKVTIETYVDGLSFYLLTNPHMNNTGFQDNAFVGSPDQGFTFQEGQTNLQVTVTPGFRRQSVGYVGFSDGFQDLQQDFTMDYFYQKALNGNVAGMGEVNLPMKKGRYEFYVIYHFSSGQKRPLTVKSDEEYHQEMQNFNESWKSYFAGLKIPSSMDLTEEEKLFYLRSLYTIKVHEDKLNPGAIVASLSIPWGETVEEKPGVEHGGYHLVWPRDLFHAAFSLLLAGDEKTPISTLNFLKKIQYKKGAGHWDYSANRRYPKYAAFPQNVWVDGREYWSGLQLDQVGYPVQLFYQVYSRASEEQKLQLKKNYGYMITDALNFIKHNGPWSGQERWEENWGISPSSFSVVTSALLLGEKLFPEHSMSEEWGNTARGWLNRPGDNIETWTYTTTGSYGDGRYYVRIAGCSSYEAVWDPNDGSQCHIANSPMKTDLRNILDQGFLQLALLGLKPAGDPKIESSLEKINQHLKVQTPKGAGWYRYSFDAYGDFGKGRLWPILAGEHARYDLAKFHQTEISALGSGSNPADPSRSRRNLWPAVYKRTHDLLKSFYQLSNEGMMIPEQVFENNGEGTEAATPLVWSHAEYIKLIWSMHYKKNIENPL